MEVSSTKVREVIADGDMRTAANLLGRAHFLSGPVVHGRDAAANWFPHRQYPEPHRVPAARRRLCYPPAARRWLARLITNIGMRPTFAEPERTIEAHVFDFDRDIYDREVRLELIERIRPERKFDSVRRSRLKSPPI